MPKLPFHQSFPVLIGRLQTPPAARIVKLIGERTQFPHEGHLTVHAWGHAMVRMGLASDPGAVGNPHDFVPEESGPGRKPFHEALLAIIPEIRTVVELWFVRTLINETDILEAGRGAIGHAWRLHLDVLGEKQNLVAAEHTIHFGDVPQEARAAAPLSQAA